MAKGKGLDLAVVFGGPAKGKPAPAEESDDMTAEDSDEVPPEFEAAITEAFPDMEGDMARMAAMKRAIEACY